MLLQCPLGVQDRPTWELGLLIHWSMTQNRLTGGMLQRQRVTLILRPFPWTCGLHCSLTILAVRPIILLFEDGAWLILVFLVSEITVTKCFVQPNLAGDTCAPRSTIEQDAIKGKWVRVARDLNLEAGIWAGWLVRSRVDLLLLNAQANQNIYYRRTRRQDINLITDIRLLPEREELDHQEGWRKVALSLRTGIYKAPPLFLWYRIGKTAAEMTAEERAQLITELDILYGEDVPWYGFEKVEPATMPQRGKVEATWLTYRRGVKGRSCQILRRCFVSQSVGLSTSTRPTPSLLSFGEIQDSSSG